MGTITRKVLRSWANFDWQVNEPVPGVCVRKILCVCVHMMVTENHKITMQPSDSTSAKH